MNNEGVHEGEVGCSTNDTVDESGIMRRVNEGK